MKKFIQDLAETHHYQSTHLLDILRLIQTHYHFIPEAAKEQLAET